MNEILSIIFGFIIYFIISTFIIWLFLFLYFTFTKRGKFKTLHIFHPALLLSVYNFIVMIISIMLLSSNLILFITSSFLLLAGGNYIILTKKYDYKQRDCIILAIGLAAAVNPGWLVFMGMI